jgi:hypothetical protein
VLRIEICGFAVKANERLRLCVWAFRCLLNQ